MKGYFSNKWNVSRVVRVSKIKRQLQFIVIKLLIDILDDHRLIFQKFYFIYIS